MCSIERSVSVSVCQGRVEFNKYIHTHSSISRNILMWQLTRATPSPLEYPEVQHRPDHAPRREEPLTYHQDKEYSVRVHLWRGGDKNRQARHRPNQTGFRPFYFNMKANKHQGREDSRRNAPALHGLPIILSIVMSYVCSDVTTQATQCTYMSLVHSLFRYRLRSRSKILATPGEDPSHDGNLSRTFGPGPKYCRWSDDAARDANCTETLLPCTL